MSGNLSESYLEEETDDSNGDDYMVPLPKIVISLLICFVGLFGNALVIFVILMLKEYKKSITNWYVLQLAIADFLFLVTILFNATEDLNNRWDFSEALCKTKETILFLNYFASCLFLVVMSVDRYIAVCQRLHKILRKLRTKQSARIITVVTWSLALLMCIPIMMYSHKMGAQPKCKCGYKFPDPDEHLRFCKREGFSLENITECIKTSKEHANNNEPLCKDSNPQSSESHLSVETTSPPDNMEYETYSDDNSSVETLSQESMAYNTYNVESQKSELTYSDMCNYWNAPNSYIAFLVFIFVGMFILPLIIMSICYSCIVIRLHDSSVRLKRSEIASRRANNLLTTRRKRKMSTGSSADRQRVTIMCVMLVASFGLFWLPFHVNHLAKIVGIPLVKEEDDLCELLPNIATLLAFLNSAVNPFLYSVKGNQFLRRLRLALFKASNSIRLTLSVTTTSRGLGSTRYTRSGTRKDSNTNSTSVVTLSTKSPKTNKSKEFARTNGQVSEDLCSSPKDLNQQQEQNLPNSKYNSLFKANKSRSTSVKGNKLKAKARKPILALVIDNKDDYETIDLFPIIRNNETDLNNKVQDPNQNSKDDLKINFQDLNQDSKDDLKINSQDLNQDSKDDLKINSQDLNQDSKDDLKINSQDLNQDSKDDLKINSLDLNQNSKDDSKIISQDLNPASKNVLMVNVLVHSSIQSSQENLRIDVSNQSQITKEDLDVNYQDQTPTPQSEI